MSRLLERIGRPVELLAASPLLAVALVGLFIVLPAFWTAQLSIDDTQSRLRATAQLGQSRDAETAANLVSAHVRGVQEDLLAAASGRFLREATARRDGALLATLVHEQAPLIGVDRDVLTLFVEDTRGELLALEPPDRSLIGQSFAERDYFIGVSREWQPFVSEVFSSALQGSPPVVVVAVPIFGPSGQPVGVLGSAIDLARAAQWLAPVLSAYDDIYLLDRNGKLIVRARGPDENTLRDLSADPTVRSAIEGRSLVAEAADPLGGGQKLLVTATAPGSDWHVIVARRVDAATRDVSPLVQNLLAVRIVTLLLMLVFAYLVSDMARRFLRERRRMAGVAAELANSERTARVAEERIASILRGATDVAIIGTDGEGTIDTFNAGAERILGYTAAELLGRTPVVFHDQSEIAARARELGIEPGFQVFVAAARRGDAETREWSYIRKDGARVPVELRVTARRSTAGEVVGFMGVATDLTERKRAAAILESASRHKSEFLANMSHELRTPLNAILGFSDLLLEQLEGALSDRQRRYLGNIKDAGEHLLELINDVLDLSKVEAGRLDLRPQRISIAELLAPTVASTRAAADAAGVRFEVIAPLELVVHVDPARARQVLYNLLSNAVKFTPRGGAVSLRVTSEANALEIVVRDTGIGIPAEKRDRVFGTFERLHEGRSEAGGTGLGLALTKRLVDLHAGRIAFESEEAVGTTFWVTLPDAVDAGEVRERLLVVEDERRDADLIVALAAKHGIATEVVTSVVDATAAIARALPLGVVLDLRLSDGRGEVVLGQLKAERRSRGVPVVVVTVEDDEGRSRPLGADDHLTKPIDHARLDGWLRQLAARRGPREEAAVASAVGG